MSTAEGNFFLKRKAGIVQREPSAVAIKTIKKFFILHGSTMSTRDFGCDIKMGTVRFVWTTRLTRVRARQLKNKQKKKTNETCKLCPALCQSDKS